MPPGLGQSTYTAIQWQAYGPPVHDDVAVGVASYRDMRVSHYFKSAEVDAAEYEAYMKKKDQEKKAQKKRKAH